MGRSTEEIIVTVLVLKLDAAINCDVRSLRRRLHEAGSQRREQARRAG
jgi:hypothetical protein